jgi:hypothetical protein
MNQVIYSFCVRVTVIILGHHTHTHTQDILNSKPNRKVSLPQQETESFPRRAC